MTDDFYTPERRREQNTTRLMTVAVAVICFVAVFWLWDRVRTLELQDAALREHVSSLVQREEVLATQSAAHTQSLTDLTGAQGGISQRIDELYGARRAGLLAAESEYLVRLASQRLALAHDAEGALTLLSAADSSLKDIRDADVHAARAAIAADSVRLREMATLDVEAVYLRLSALPASVDAIAGRALPARVAKKKPAAAVPGNAADDQGWWSRLGAELKTLIHIRRVDAPIAPLVKRGERELAAQNFRLLVEQAQIALLQRQGAIYLHSLEQADAWLDRLAAGDPAARNGVRREIASLRAIAPDAAPPELSASLAATRSLAIHLVPEAGSAR